MSTIQLEFILAILATRIFTKPLSYLSLRFNVCSSVSQVNLQIIKIKYGNITQS